MENGNSYEVSSTPGSKMSTKSEFFCTQLLGVFSLILGLVSGLLIGIYLYHGEPDGSVRCKDLPELTKQEIRTTAIPVLRAQQTQPSTSPDLEDLLFPPREGVEYRTRDQVPLLQVKYPVYVAALYTLITDWLDGKVGIGKPTDEWENVFVAEVNKDVNLLNDSSRYTDQSNGELEQVYNEMVEIKVPGHLKIVTSHRKWLRLSLEFLDKINANCSDKLPRLVRIHDLSKFTHREVLGYAVMFGDGRVDWRQLETEAEQTEWDNSVYNHYAANPHHPQFFYTLKEDGSRDKSVPMIEIDPVNGKDYVDESLIDMLAARGERTLANENPFNVKQWMDIPERYMLRYSVQDKAYATRRFDEFKRLAEDYLSIESNAGKLKGFFDIDGKPERSVIFREYETDNSN